MMAAMALAVFFSPFVISSTWSNFGTCNASAKLIKLPGIHSSRPMMDHLFYSKLLCPWPSFWEQFLNHRLWWALFYLFFFFVTSMILLSWFPSTNRLDRVRNLNYCDFVMHSPDLAWHKQQNRINPSLYYKS